MSIEVKICGIKTKDTLMAAIEGGANFIGFVFYPKSPRYVEPSLAAELARLIPAGIKIVGLFVDPEFDLLDQVTTLVPLDFIQLHGSEDPEFIRGMKGFFPLPVIKAFSVAEKEDLDQVKTYETCVEWFLFDAKPPKNVVTTLPGGNGIAFDWTILADADISKPWMLSGGLNADNVAEAIKISGTKAVDVSSGVEDKPGEKSSEKIVEFIKEAKK